MTDSKLELPLDDPGSANSVPLPAPQLQVAFSSALDNARNQILLDALLETVSKLDIARLDAELKEYVPERALSMLAGRGLRGELMFATPYVLEANPRLLGYYRLLLGYSQKEFYTARTGAGKFKGMEVKGLFSKVHRAGLHELCSSLTKSAVWLLEGISGTLLTKDRLDDLTLLTLGPQFRGSSNVAKGIAAIGEVFDLLKEITRLSNPTVTPRRIEVVNDSNLKVLIEFAADPDIVIRGELSPGNYDNILAIEVKGGDDFSNIHNRVGEAEKSHQKAKSNGFAQCWTVVNVDDINLQEAERESPSTNRFYILSTLTPRSGPQWDDFRQRIARMIGIKSQP